MRRGELLALQWEDIDFETGAVRIERQVQAIGGRLTSIVLPDGLSSIGKNTFESCRSLTSITIPDRVTEIGRDAFKECPNLTIITPNGSYAEKCAKRRKIPVVSE